MGFNILKHELVPYHQILSKREVEKLLKAYKIEKEKLPKILVTDPVAIAVGARVGQVVKIIRKSPTAGESISYRLVVSSEG
jgi:DNA-directed RNA polymerase subunit H